MKSAVINSTLAKQTSSSGKHRSSNKTRMGPYNGYSGAERIEKYEEYKRLKKLRKSVPEVGPCQLCGDPDTKVGPHTEDYSRPYKWLPPAEYMICRSCHWWVHMRFKRPGDWLDFISHVSRGGYGQEFTSAEVLTERKLAATARGQVEAYAWSRTPGRKSRKRGWWQRLSTGGSK
jgi:hypothetical protein